MTSNISKYFILLIAFIAVMVPVTAQAENMADLLSNTNHVDMPNVSNETSGALPMAYPILNMTQDKSEMIKLKGEAASVIVGNPAHINVMLDTPCLLYTSDAADE